MTTTHAHYEDTRKVAGLIKRQPAQSDADRYGTKRHAHQPAHGPTRKSSSKEICDV